MYTLLQNPTQDQESWRFTVPNNHLTPPRRRNEKNIYGKLIKFTADAITLEISQFPSSRILRSDDPSKFLLVSFEKLRFPEGGLRVTADYITRMMKAGVFINGVQYRFYHHSNSQLRSRTCFMRAANNDVELDDRIYRLGDYGRIMNAAKRAKRIGLLFSAAELDIQLDPKWTTDIEDIENVDTIFSDGCGLMSKHWAIQVSKAKKIIFRNQRYVPCVLQIRYLGYKGVLMMHPDMDKEKKYLAKFRKSMKKFTTTQDHSFSVVGYSKPYAFGRLNNDIIVLLSSLGVTNEKLMAKQEAYFRWIEEASTDVAKAVDFASCLEQYDVAERVLLNGLDDPTVSAQIRRVQMAEVSQFLKNERPRARMIIHRSRLLYGVCDPFKVLKEGQVHIRITSQKGATTPINGDVLVVRNPCLHPGDCLKLRAVSHPSLDHLVDCIVFASDAKPKHQAAPAMSSGGDLDGDKFFVCWDPDVVPPRVHESYDYPPNKERPGGNVTRQDLATHFAMYNNVGLAQITKLHQQWIRGSPKGAMSPECQELNALHSRSVDGAKVRIPERLRKPPAKDGPFILDILADAAEKFRTRFSTGVANELDPATTSPEDAEDVLAHLFKNKPEAVSEYELFSMAVAFARKYSINLFELKHYLAHLDFSALTAHEKHAISTTLGLSPTEHRRMWNSLLTSDILSMRDLQQRQLDRPLSMQRLYSAAEKSTATFFQYLRIAFEQYTRKLLILKTDDRFAVGIFIKGVTLWDEDPEVDENVVVCSFMPKATESMSVYRPCTAGYRLHCSDGNLQLYDKHMANTFIFISRSPETGKDVITSIALQKISKRVGQQLGRLNKAPVTSIEIHVISNRDRVAHQLFDMYLEHVQTEEYVRRFARELIPYNVKSVRDVDWSAHPEWMKGLFVPRISEEMVFKQLLSDLQHGQLRTLMTFALQHRADNELYWTFDFVVALQPLMVDMITTCLHQNPALAYVLLRAYPPTDSLLLPEQLVDLKVPILRAILRSANSLGVATLVALEKISQSVNNIDMSEYVELLMLAALSIRPKTLLQETLLVLHESTSASREGSPATAYLHKHALAIAFDCAEEAADVCPCDDTGRPRSTKSSYPVLRLVQAEDAAEGHVDVHFRVDLSVPIRLHSHVRLQCVSDPENAFIDRAVVDGVVTKSGRGEITVEMYHTLPPEFAVMQWRIFDAGSLATARAMMDAVTKLWQDSYECCSIYDTIVMPPPQTASEAVGDHPGEEDELVGTESMNPSQIIAIRSSLAPLSLIWGPPGTGKTTVVVQILRYLLRKFPDCKILMTASTHNAVDNVLERFLELNKEHRLLSDDLILRVATDHSKVSKALQSYTIDARVGGDLHEHSRLQRQAQQRVKAARIAFTTCAGAGLGTLRKIDFDTVLIDEASQLTEPTALVPLVKGCKRAVLVGDHVQLRPTVKPMGKVLEYDVSLMERLYTSNAHPGTVKTMLNVQYRFPSELADFPSTEFYHGELQSHIQDSAPVLARLAATAFPWPRVGQEQRLVPTVFVQCASEETTGSASKGNEGQVELAARIITLLQQPRDQDQDGAQEGQPKLSIAALSPYAKQVSLLKSAVPSSVTCATIDAFQGRESDVVVFSSVRCNVTREIGFVDDPRRLNVMWTRARLGLIILGDQATMTETNALWRRAIGSCTVATLPPVPVTS